MAPYLVIPMNTFRKWFCWTVRCGNYTPLYGRMFMQFMGLIGGSFISLTWRLNLFFGNDVPSNAILSTDLIAFIYVDIMLLTLFRHSPLTKTWV